MNRIRSEVEAALSRLYRGGALGLAVSGGGDSMALLEIARPWAARRGVRLAVATVDHGLRPESAAEAAAVAGAAQGLSHDILTWTGWDRQGNLQAEARRARRRLLAGWARRRGLSAVCLGHTMDDQAETVLMRLGRGAGVDGLSAMAAESRADDMRWLRPLLGHRRAALRDFLTAQGVGWADDPSNEDTAFDRVRARRALAAVADLGVSVEGLADTAERMRAARTALDHGVSELAEKAARWGRCGELRLALDPLRRAPAELSRRLLRAGLTRAAGAEYGPRAEAEEALLSSMLGLRLGGGRSLHGCLIRPDGAGHAVIMREAAAVSAAPAPLPAEGALWDGRFRLIPRTPLDGAAVAPLGEKGARRLSELSDKGLWSPPEGWARAPRGARLTTPALWRGEALAAAPLAAFGDALSAEFAPRARGWGDAA